MSEFDVRRADIFSAAYYELIQLASLHGELTLQAEVRALMDRTSGKLEQAVSGHAAAGDTR